MKMFSDNIIIATKIDSPLEDNPNLNLSFLFGIRDIFALSSLLQMTALEKIGLPIRGGISIGNLYIDDNLVWGSALVNAYSLENSVAIYPRIVIDDLLYDIIFNKNIPSNDYNYQKIIDTIKNYFDYDSDGLHFLNYYNLFDYFEKWSIDQFNKSVLGLPSRKVTGDDIAQISIQHRLILGKKCLGTLLEKCSDIRHYQKIVWIVNYHNSICVRYNLLGYQIQDAVCQETLLRIQNNHGGMT